MLPRIEVSQHAFKTPTLRNAALRAPYLHNGSAPTLEFIVDFYDRGGNALRVSLATEIRPLHLTSAEKQDLLQFLQTLTARDPAVEFPVLPR